MTTGLVAAAAAALCYGLGSVLQAIGAGRTGTASGLDPRLLSRLSRQWPYVAGTALDLVGFVVNVVALHSLPLFLVQSVIAGSVGVTALAAVVLLGSRLRGREATALVVLLVGLVLLAAGAEPGRARALSRVAQWSLLGSLPVTTVVAWSVARRQGRWAAALLAALAGVAFGGLGIAARGLATPHPWWHAVTSPLAWAVVGFGGLAVLLFATALQRGSVTVVAAVMSTVETVLPSVVGLTVLGDATRSGAGTGLAVAGFALALGGSVALAPYAEPVASGE